MLNLESEPDVVHANRVGGPSRLDKSPAPDLPTSLGGTGGGRTQGGAGGHWWWGCTAFVESAIPQFGATVTHQNSATTLHFDQETPAPLGSGGPGRADPGTLLVPLEKGEVLR